MQTMKGQLGLRSSALSPTSSKITTQYLVLDHMNNHYRKIVGAKSAIDNKPPKALKSSQKIRDRKTREYVKKTGSRPVSRMTPSRPHSQMQYYDSEDYDDENQWGEYDPDDEEERLVQNIMRTTLRPKSSSVNATHGSETEPTDRQYQYQDHANTNVQQQQRPLSANARWMKTRTMMSAVKAINAPTSARGDKTYDGDLLEKRSHAFTEEKPFTPRTLKTKNRASRLSEYKYYTPPPQKRSSKKTEEQASENQKREAPTPKPRPRQSAKSPQRVDASMTDTLMFESLQSRDFSRFEDKDGLVPKLDISLDKDHMNWLQEQASKAQIRAKSGTLRSSMSRIREDEMMESSEFDQTRNMSTLDKTNTRDFGNTTLSTSHQLKKE